MRGSVGSRTTDVQMRPGGVRRDGADTGDGFAVLGLRDLVHCATQPRPQPPSTSVPTFRYSPGLAAMPRPEDAARKTIDDALVAAGWVVQDRDALNLHAARGVAVRHFATGIPEHLGSFEEGGDFATREHGGQMRGPSRGLEAGELGHVHFEDALAQEDDGAGGLGLVLGRSGDATLRGEVQATSPHDGRARDHRLPQRGNGRACEMCRVRSPRGRRFCHGVRRRLHILRSCVLRPRRANPRGWGVMQRQSNYTVGLRGTLLNDELTHCVDPSDALSLSHERLCS